MVWSEDEQEIIGSGEVDGAAMLSQLTEKAQSRQVKVLVPSCDVCMKVVGLPGKFNRQVLAALPFMLEDDLTQDVDELFFAHGKRTQLDGNPAIEVAIVSRQLMEDWLAWLDAAQLPTSIMVPDALCLPIADSGPTAIELNGQWLVRGGQWQCDSVDNIWIEQYLNLSASRYLATTPLEEGEEDTRERLNLLCYSPLAVECEDLVITDVDRQLPLQLFVNEIDRSGFNLRQGEFIQKKESSAAWKTWRMAAVFFVSAILLQLGYRGATAWQLSNELEVQKAEFVSQFKKAYPGDRTRTALIERQLKRRLKEANGGGGNSAGLLTILAKVAPLLSQNKGFTPEMIKYDNKRGELRLNAVGDGYQSFEKFKTAVENLGFEVQQGSLSNNDDKVAGAITIKGA
jgi:general secretion pathway protein L